MIITSVRRLDRAYRGGSWNNVALLARAASRIANGPSRRLDDLGLRLMRRFS